jgi:DEAD/DEAH box helicase domain-containing protein
MPLMSERVLSVITSTLIVYHRLILATSHSEDPVILLQAAARDHIPVDPKGHIPDRALVQVPETKDRPAITDVISELRSAIWYRDQILDHRIFEARDPQSGSYTCFVDLYTVL